VSVRRESEKIDRLKLKRGRRKRRRVRLNKLDIWQNSKHNAMPWTHCDNVRMKISNDKMHARVNP